MCWKGKLLLAAAALSLTAAGVSTAISAAVPDPVEAPPSVKAETAEEYHRTIEAMKPPKRARPVVAVLGDNRGTEAIDFLVPYGVLKKSDVADVFAVGMTSGPLRLRPALTIRAQLNVAELDARYLGIEGLVVVGLTTNHCVSTTVRMAGNLGFHCAIVTDATATFDRKTVDGRNRPAQEVHDAALSDLDGEFATVITTSHFALAPQEVATAAIL